MATTPERRVKIFFSYAHEDDALVDSCRAQLSLFDRQHLICWWHDRQIPAGAEWQRFIDRNLSNSDVVLLFVSPDFLRSDYCYGVEMQEALKRHDSGAAQVIPVILRPCPWEQSPVAKLQVLPTGGRALTQWEDRDEASLNVAEGIMRAVQHATARDAAPPTDQPPMPLPESDSLPPELTAVQCSSQTCRSNDVRLTELPVEIASVDEVAGGGWIAKGRVQVQYSVDGRCLTCGRIFDVVRRAIPMEFADLACNECGERGYLEYRPTGFHKVDGGYEFGVDIRCSDCQGRRTVSRVLRSMLRVVGIDVGRSGIKVRETS
jgi:DNA-directed RNA polymerase subunit RPC12/RpoP